MWGFSRGGKWTHGNGARSCGLEKSFSAPAPSFLLRHLANNYPRLALPSCCSRCADLRIQHCPCPPRLQRMTQVIMLQSKGHNWESMCISEQSSFICFSRLVSGTDLQVKQKVSTGKLKGGDNTVPSVSLSEACRKEFHEG